MNNQPTPILQEKDIVYSYLADLKRSAREYTTAVTESNCPVVRQMFEQLLQDTLQYQDQAYQLMSQNGWYEAPASAPNMEIMKQIQSYQQTQTQTNQMLQQNLGMS